MVVQEVNDAALQLQSTRIDPELGLCVCGVFQVFRFPPTSQKHASCWIGTSKLPLDDGAHQWTDMPSRVYSWLVPRSAATFTY